MARHVIGTIDEIPPGTRKIVEIGGRSIGVFNVNGEFFALRNRCPHQGGPLCLGNLSGLTESPLPGEYHLTRDGEMVRCPWHGWEFDVKTGQSWFDPMRVRVRSYEVTVEREEPRSSIMQPPLEGLTPGPYRAETYPVAVERRNVIVEIDTPGTIVR